MGDFLSCVVEGVSTTVDGTSISMLYNDGSFPRDVYERVVFSVPFPLAVREGDSIDLYQGIITRGMGTLFVRDYDYCGITVCRGDEVVLNMCSDDIVARKEMYQGFRSSVA